MSEWKEYRLEEVADIIGGGTPKTEVPEYWNGLIPWITPRDLSNSKERYILRGERNISEVGLTSSSAKLIPKGSVLLSSRAPVGYLAISDCVVTTNQGFRSLVPLPDRSDTTFLFYLLKANVDFLISQASGTTFQELAGGVLKELSFLFPPLPEQRAIAGVLSSLDDKINLLHRQNKTLEGMAEALWRKMFVEEADPDWDEKGLDEIADFLNGIPCQKYPPDTANEPLPVIKIKELRSGFTDDSDMATSAIPPEYIINDGDILFSWSGSLEIIIWSFGKGALNQHLFKVTSDKYPKWFYYYAIKQHLSEFRDIAQDKATTMGHIQRHHLTAAKVFIPDNASFNEINTQFDPLFNKITYNLKAIRTYAKLRDTILPKLMSGKVRVKQ